MNFYFLYCDNRVPLNLARLCSTDLVTDPTVFFCPSRPAPGQEDDPFTETHPLNRWTGARVRTPYTTRLFEIDSLELLLRRKRELHAVDVTDEQHLDHGFLVKSP